MSDRMVEPIPKPKKRGKRQTNPEWRRSRNWCLERAGHRCEAKAPGCTVRAEHAHHIQLRSQGGPDDPSNLLAVCHRCHDWIHRNVAAAVEQGFIAQGGAR